MGDKILQMGDKFRCADLYDVPADQRGFLRRYRNRRVRIVCMGSWNQYTGRWYFVAAVPLN